MSVVSAVELVNVGFSYGANMVLRDVTARIEPGAYVGIVGPNGSGKTTLIQMIVGLLVPSTGSVAILGKSVEEAQRAGAIGYVSQRPDNAVASFPATVFEVVSNGGIHTADKVQMALQAVDMASFANRLFTQLSGGQRQRVWIARALATQPTILALDEPTTGIDVREQARFYELLAQLNQKQHVTILYVTHDLDVIAKQAQQVLCINGTIACSLSGPDLLSPNMIRSVYGDRMSVIHHHHHGTHT
ncbi:zinc ABC transporter ATP-binding protein [Candidatus Roizmanbacteria bacterium CG10_big_fil_rev_8_21_14_0_10_45_7]|uniref:Zinc ABC transporter ATP-binding protein n=1 Tax=Candidatus Roizmanbacteria bacterium CG10_big_fil_rev_8_21_14_0_10_45_7 TaxID=1974854 RepID=A0A2M8KU46_9BACT|nr:MAG: zinc ABC transporter ATP-binding protein [Candidatus Roizmanbacteria bacterium CG10_big_fil_rev_8_21_14_0_10_45_7]